MRNALRPVTAPGPVTRALRAATLLLGGGLVLAGCAHAPEREAAAIAAVAPPAELSFRDIYRMPIGPVGLEPSEKLLALRGQRVHMQGYMVESEEPEAGIFLLTPMPVSLSEKDEGQADDLPATTVFVHLPPSLAQVVVPHQPEPVDVIGVLELGAREERSGRVSYLRLLAEPPSVRRTATAKSSASPMLSKR